MENKNLKFSIGIDVVRIDRFENMEEIFFKKVFTENEKKNFLKISSENGKKIFLAKTWALKEAIFKSNNSYIMKKIEINLEAEKPYCVNEKFLSLSLSYSGKIITAVALYMKVDN